MALRGPDHGAQGGRVVCGPSGPDPDAGRPAGPWPPEAREAGAGGTPGDPRSVGVDHQIDVQRLIDHSSPTRRWCTTNAFVPNSTKSAPSSAATTTSRLSRNSASNAALVMFPVATTNNRRGEIAKKWPSRKKILIVRHYHTAAAVGELRDPGVCAAVAVRESRCVHGGMPSLVQETSEPSGQLSVDEELHAAPSGITRPPPAASAPNSRAARMSSRSRSG